MFPLYLLFTSLVIYISLDSVKSVQIRGFFWSVFYFSHSVIYTHLILTLYYYTGFYKIDKIWEIEIMTKFSAVKSVSSIDDDYLEAVTGGVLQKKLFLKVL